MRLRRSPTMRPGLESKAADSSRLNEMQYEICRTGYRQDRAVNLTDFWSGKLAQFRAIEKTWGLSANYIGLIRLTNHAKRGDRIGQHHQHVIVIITRFFSYVVIAI